MIWQQRHQNYNTIMCIFYVIIWTYFDKLKHIFYARNNHTIVLNWVYKVTAAGFDWVAIYHSGYLGATVEMEFISTTNGKNGMFSDLGFVREQAPLVGVGVAHDLNSNRFW